LGSVAIYAFGFAIPYTLDDGLQRPLTDFARLTGPSLGPTLALVASITALFVCYALALRLCIELEGSRRAALLVFGFAALAALSLLLMYPMFSLDIFYYMNADRIWSVYRENPFVVPPLQGAHDPFFPYNAWGHYPLPYGPLWPWITRATGFFGGGAVYPTLLAFKGLSVLGYLLCLPILAWALKAVRPERRLTGLCIFAWNPLVLLELAGGGHNDAVALVPAALALGLWARRRTVSTALAGTISFLVKATVSIALPALLWPSFRRAAGQKRIAGWALVHLAPALGLFVLTWLPFWTTTNATSFLREADQYHHSLTAVAMAALPAAWKVDAIRWLQAALLAIFAVYYLSQLSQLSIEGSPALRSVWRIMVLYMLVVSPFYSGWYMVWPTFVAGMLAERRVTTLTALLGIGSLATYVVQFVIRPLAVPSLSAAELNALGALAASGPFLGGWAFLLWRQRVGRRMGTALLAQAEAPG
jgi:hypothetical protein